MSGIDRSRIEPIYNTVVADGVIPAATQKTGTITSSGTTVTGSGTSFKILAQVRAGDYIYAQNQVRKVISIFSNTRLDVNRAFVPDIGVGVDLYVIRHIPNLKVALANEGGGSAEINTTEYDGKVLEEGDVIMYDSLNGLGPVAYVPNGATIEINNGEISKSGTATVIGSIEVTGQDNDNTPQTETKPVYVGAKAVDATTYSPAYTAGDAAGFAVDKDNGGLNVNQGVISSTTDSIVAYGKIVEIKPTLVVDTAIYAALDNIGGKQTLTSVARASGEGVFLQSINIQVKEAVTPILDIYFFNADPTSGTYTDNAAMVIGSTDILKAIHVQQVVAADYKSVGTVRFASVQVYKDMVPSGSSTLYAAIMIASGTPTFANASNLQISYIFER